MAYFMVTPKELYSTAATLREYNSNFKAQVEALESAEGTLNASWEGSAKDTFHASFMNDKAYMETFATEIEKYCTTLEEMASDYEKSENTNIDIASTRKY